MPATTRLNHRLRIDPQGEWTEGSVADFRRRFHAVFVATPGEGGDQARALLEQTPG